MPVVADSWTEESSGTLRCEIRVMADAGTQLKKVFVRDKLDMPIGFEPAVEPCNSNYYVAIATGIARNRLPLNVEVVQCDGSRFGPGDNPELPELPSFINDPDHLPGYAECADLFGIPNPACEEAKIRARIERSNLSIRCREEADCSRDYREYLALAAATAAAWLAAFVAGMSAITSGGWIGIIVGVIALAVSAAYAIVSAWATDKAIRKRTELMALRVRLSLQRAVFESRLRAVNSRCCPDQRLYREEIEMPC